MLRTALLGGNSISLDADMSKYIETLSEQGVIDGLEVSSNSVAPGKAWVKATRSNGETIMVLVQNTEALSVDTTGTKKIWLEIKQEAIDNGALNNEDGTGIAEIKTGSSVPSQNFLLLASVAENVVKDERNPIPKIQSVDQRTSTLEIKMETAEEKITGLIAAGTPDYLGKVAIVGESYKEGDIMTIRGGKLIKKKSIISFGGLDQYVSNYHYLGEFTVEQDCDYVLNIKDYKVHSYYGVFVLSKRKFNSKTEAESSSNDRIFKYDIGSGDVNVGLPEMQVGQKVYVGFYPYEGSPKVNFSSCSIISIKKGVDILYHPRETKAVGQKVECTILGVHTNGQFIGQAIRVDINKKISGNASSERIAPLNGFLFYKCSSYYNNNGVGANAFINNIKVSSGVSVNGLIYVSAGTVSLKTEHFSSGGSSYSSTLELLEFIPL